MKRIALFGLAVVLMAPGVVLARQSNPIGPVAQIAGARWQTERAGMIKLVLDRARSHAGRVRVLVEIGTMAPLDARSADVLLGDLEKRIEADASAGTNRPAPALSEISAVRIRFAEALNALDVVEVRLDVGLATTDAVNASLTAAAAVLLGPDPRK